MRFLRFLGRWYLILTIVAWIVLGADPRTTAGVLLVALVAGNAWHRHKVAELRRQHWTTPYPYPVYWPVPWYPPSPTPERQGQPGSPSSTGPLESATEAEAPSNWSDGKHGSSGRKGPAAAIALGVAALVALAGAALVHPARAEAATLPAAGVSSHRAAPELSVPNPLDWYFEHAFANPFRAGTQKTLKTALNASEASFLTPALDGQARVQQLWKLLVEVADALLLLLVVVGAIMVIAGDWSYLEAKALAPRVIVAGVAANLSLLVTGLAIGWSNDLVKGFLSFGDSSLTPAVSNLISTERTALILALLLVVVLFLLIANLLRLVIVLTLAVAGPLMITFGVLPASDGVARMWWKAMAACLIAPIVQVLLLVLGVWVVASGSPFAATFSKVAGANLVDSVMLIVIVLLMAISPLWMLKRALGESHRHLLSAARWGRRAAGVLS